MVEAYYEFCHQTLGVHMYTIPLIIAAALAVLFGLLHWRKQNKREKEFQDELEKKYNSNAGGASASDPSRTA
ncbi:MAG: hypothetical protein I3I98_06010 [Mobilibacterium timonense]|uniref:hypothetical protein n=2 Tax=Mobilibacterium timonense TaxID=1871012 RepID=UPI0023557F2F|nr:hypothetical protein [Mobilibacterium timonense]MBM6990932.1 hypothetical protein [Mobilibacterium timonense]